MIIQRYRYKSCESIPKRFSIGAGVGIITTNTCIFCRTDFANLMTTEKPDLGPQTRICSIKPGKYLSSVLSV